MRFLRTPLEGAWIVEPERHVDERGFFARTFCRDEFAAHGLHSLFVQCNVSYNERKGTLRGMHYQAEPFEEVKLVRCTAGAVFDVIIDLRPQSPSFKQWFGVELSAENGSMLYIPAAFAHGFQTLADHSEVFYQMGEAYHPQAARGVRWNDPEFTIEWPLAEAIVSARDAQFADYLG